jgi:oxygen-independent coproporphyrinogen-3 oxidase
VIQRLLCDAGVDARAFRERFGTDCAARFGAEQQPLDRLERDGIVSRAGDGSLRVTPLGRLVLRAVAMVFGAYLARQQSEARPLFCQTI